jgi:hypothetical protein
MLQIEHKSTNSVVAIGMHNDIIYLMIYWLMPIAYITHVVTKKNKTKFLGEFYFWICNSGSN